MVRRARAMDVTFANAKSLAVEARASLIEAGGRIVKASHGWRGRRKEARELKEFSSYPPE
jgi:hypothetical protein